MDSKNFWAFMGVSVLVFALALAAGGCGGSSNGPVGTNTDQGGGGLKP